MRLNGLLDTGAANLHPLSDALSRLCRLILFLSRVHTDSGSAAATLRHSVERRSRTAASEVAVTSVCALPLP